jgi:hypothetical protein
MGVLMVTDFTSNPAIPLAKLARAPEDNVYPREPFGRCVWTVWVRQSVGLTPAFLSELVEGKLLHLRGLEVVAMPGDRGIMGDMNRREGQGARVSVTKMPDSDDRAKKILR